MPNPPPARRLCSMVYDESRGVCVLFGGVSGWQAREDTWEYDGKEWRLVATHGPKPRFAAGMAYDALGNRVVVHGGAGYEFQPAFADIWQWDGKQWTEVLTGNRGPALWGHSLAFDPERAEFVVSFGYSGQWQPISKATWTLKNGVWEQHSSGDLRERVDHASLFHPSFKKTILFGGRDRRRYSDLWTWDGESWESDDPAPPSYVGGGLPTTLPIETSFISAAR